MSLDSGVSLGTLLLTMGGLLVAGGIAWGSISQRVKSLEREMEALAGLSERLAKIETTTGYIKDELGKLTGSWLFREPPSYEAIERPIGTPAPQRPRRTR